MYRIISLGLSLIVILLSSCSIDEDYRMNLTCTSYYDEKKINDFNLYLKREKNNLSFLEGSISAGIDTAFKENVEYCLREGIPFQKHVYLFDKNQYDAFGEYDVSHSYSDCMLGKSSMMEKLETMKVTENYLIFGNSNSLRFDKKKMIANKNFILGDMDFGNYKYDCVINRI